MVVVDRIDRGLVDEVDDVDGPRLLGVERLELVGLDHDIVVRRDLIALDDALEGHLLTGLGVHPLLLDARPRVGVELMEADRLSRHGAVELDRHVDQPEGDGAAPDRARHTVKVYPKPRPFGTLGRTIAGWARACDRLNGLAEPV